MNKIIGLLCLVICIDLNAAILLTNIPENGGYRLLGSGANIKSLKFYSASESILKFYDENDTSSVVFGTNQRVLIYRMRISSIVTNVSGPYVGGSGFTNYMTNIVLSTSLTTNGIAPLTEAPRVFEVYIPPATYLNIDTDTVLVRGLFVHADPATNVSVTIDYKNP